MPLLFYLPLIIWSGLFGVFDAERVVAKAPNQADKD
jgi:hypothetical protein